jgi:apolipoprotein N-acyltransferase
VGALAYGLAALRAAPPVDAETGLPVAIVQPNLAVGSQWRAGAYSEHLRETLQLTSEAVESGTARIAFWPESALTFFLEEEPLLRRAIAGTLARHDLELVLGGPSVSDSDAADPDYYNSIFVLDPRGSQQGRYDKQQLVPFAEFLPLRRFDFLRRRFERVRAFRHGAPSPPLPTRAGPAGILVCNEAMYPEVARARVREGASYLVNPSNDTWIQSSVWADRMLDLVALRAVEGRRTLVRTSTAGPSAIVDPWGRIRGRTGTFEPAILRGYVEPDQALSVYARLGDAFAWACIGSAFAALVVTSRSRPQPEG